MRFLSLFAFVATGVFPLFAEPAVIHSTTSLRPGQTLKVEIQEEVKPNPLLVWGEREIPFYFSRHKTWRALTPVPLEAEPKKETLIVKGEEGFFYRDFEAPFQIQIVPSDFGFETIRFSKTKAKLLNQHSEDEESRIIREYLQKTRFDKEQHWEGLFIKPVPGKVKSPFGMKRNKVGQDELDFHKGVDLAGKRGEKIKAPNGAVVLMTREFQFHGHTVLLGHGQGVGSIYIHMNEIHVQEGDHVQKGDVLGTVGSTGLSTAPHLHWGIYVLGEAVDPLQWLKTEF